MAGQQFGQLSNATPDQRSAIAADVVAGLVGGPVDALTGFAAKQAADFARRTTEQIAPTDGEHCSGLNAIATGLDQVADEIKSGVAWVASDLLGLPDFIGDVLGRVVATAVTEPWQLKNISRALRMVDTAACTMDGHLGECASARHLAVDVFEHSVREDLKKVFDDAVTRNGLSLPSTDPHESALRLPEPAKVTEPTRPPTSVPRLPSSVQGPDVNDRFRGRSFGLG